MECMTFWILDAMRGGKKEKGRVVDYLAEIISIYKNIINAKRKEGKKK